MFLIGALAFWIFVGAATNHASDDGDDLLPPPHAYEMDARDIDVWDKHPVGAEQVKPGFSINHYHN